jgi:hypothetical protein
MSALETRWDESTGAPGDAPPKAELAEVARNGHGGHRAPGAKYRWGSGRI